MEKDEIVKEIKKIKTSIKELQDKLTPLKNELLKIENKNTLEDLQSYIRIGSKCFIPMKNGSGYKITITDIAQKKNGWIEITGLTNGGIKFTREFKFYKKISEYEKTRLYDERNYYCHWYLIVKKY